jgi:hypothetical protein
VISLKALDDRVENLEAMLLHGGSPLVRLKVRSMRTTSITSGTIKTSLSVPYVQIDSAGVLIVSGLAGSAVLRLKNDPTSTITEFREDDGGVAISSDQTNTVSLRLYDTAYGAPNQRMELTHSTTQSLLEFMDTSEVSTFQIRNVYAAGTVEINSLDSGDLMLSSASAQVTVDSDFEPETDDTLWLGDYGKAWKGLQLKDTTDGKWYKVVSTNGALVISEETS